MEKYNADAVWRGTLALIAERVNEGTYRIWFEPTVALGFTENAFVIGAASDFARDWIDTRFHALIADCLAEVLGDSIGCRIVVSPELARRMHEERQEPGPTPPSSQADLGTPGQATAAEGEPTGPGRRTRRSGVGLPGASPDSPIEPSLSITSLTAPAASDRALSPGAALGLNDKYTFESFVIGPSNRFAHAAALAVAETPGNVYNPLFLYGGVGLGKTHLLQAIGHYVVRQSPHLRVRFVTIETFTNDFINSLRDDTIEGFKRRYRTNDVLLIDDVQFLERKEQTQEEFFHTFNSLYEAGKQIVITSDRHPKALLTLEDRLVSRFEWGLTVDIQPPDLETRIAILRKRVQAERIPVADDEILTYIASRVATNIRELEGCLTRVVAFCSFSARPIDVAAAREVLQDIPETASTRITIDLILNAVSQLTGVSVTEMKGDKRSRHIVEARHLAMYLARELTDESLPKIGDRLGGRDHTTVLHAVDKISKLMAENRDMYNQVQLLTTRIKSAR